MVTQKPNENGVYEPEITEEVARRGRSHASIEIAQCDDGLYRFALDVMTSNAGFCGPIHKGTEGYTSVATAKDAAIVKLLVRLPTLKPGEPQSLADELRDLRAQAETALCEPTLF